MLLRLLGTAQAEGFERPREKCSPQGQTYKKKSGIPSSPD